MKTSSIVLLIVLLTSCQSEKSSKEERAGGADQLNTTLVSDRFESLLKHEVDSTSFPRSLEPNGEVRGVPSKDWTSGFFPGNLLFIYQLTGNEQYLQQAKEWIPFIEKEKLNAKTHDMGFKVFCSYGNAYRLTSNPEYAEVIVDAAKTLVTRFDPEVGCIKSWDFGGDRWTFPVIIDNMMNLELLFEAAMISGDSSFHEMAVSHANTTLKNHFRSDYSSYHVIDYDPESGKVLNRLTHQGLNAESSWARGQAWGLYGFTMAYRYTYNQAYMDQAIAISDYVFGHSNIPDDLVPYWDLVDPEIPNSPRDASAAAVMASALLELANYDLESKEDHLGKAEKILSSLSSDVYVLGNQKSAPFILNHSTGNMPKEDEVDLPIVYADYYFLEAMVRAEKTINND